jgi:biopolymer transport protein ExbD
MNVAPILGVLMVIFVGFSWLLPMVTIQIPRDLHDIACGAEGTAAISLHADGSIDLRTAATLRHFEAPQVAQALAELRDRPLDPHPVFQKVVHLQADDGVLWGDFVATVSSVRHITGGEVLVVADDD